MMIGLIYILSCSKEDSFDVSSSSQVAVLVTKYRLDGYFIRLSNKEVNTDEQMIADDFSEETL